MKRIERAMEVLDFWYATEYLQPNEFPNYTKTDKNVSTKHKTEPKYQTYYFHFEKDICISKCLESTQGNQLMEQDDEIQMCVGKISMRPIIELIFKSTGELPPEEIESKQLSLFSLRVDSTGNYIEETLQVSPFIWCSNAIISNCDLIFDRIGPTDTMQYCKQFEDLLIDKSISLSQKLDDLYQRISTDLLPFLNEESRMKSRKGAVVFTKYKDAKAKLNYGQEYTYSDLQKSYFLKDLNMIRKRASKESKVLDYILALDEPQRQKINMLTNVSKIREWYAPDKLPLARWPSNYNLSFMQQLAVNIGSKESDKVGAVFSVNGPPGTGKTTLVKEIIVANIIERASELMKYNSPNDAFTEKKLSVKYDRDKAVYYVPDEEINKYGMFVLSSNNTAVENITRELPKASPMKQKKTKTDLFDLEKTTHSIDWEKNNKREKEIYFSSPASSIAGNETCWGLISARLGKRENISEFCRLLDKIVYHNFSKEDAKSGKLSFWKAKKEYKDQLEQVLSMRRPIEESIAAELELNKEQLRFEKFVRATEAEITKRKKTLSLTKSEIEANLFLEGDSQEQIINKESNLKRAIQDLNYQIRGLEDKKNFFERKIPNPQTLVKKIIAKIFHTKRMDLIRVKREEKRQKVKLMQILKLQKERLTQEIRLQQRIEVFQRARKELEQKGVRFLTEAFLDGLAAGHGEPYETGHVESFFVYEKYSVEQERLFYKAMMLHKAFYLGSSHLRHNMILLLKYWGYKKLDGLPYPFTKSDKTNFAAALFNSLFLLVPVISSTFASIQSLLQDIVEENSLGMMIVDEAGQSTPQMALGAFWRCRRAIVVGDPKQVEPIVTLPDSIYRRLFSHNETIGNYINKNLSVQTFADTINRFSGKLMTEEYGQPREEWVGCPLVVHRRCIEPMFTISNNLAYGGLMVNQTKEPAEEGQFIRNTSCWIQCEGKEVGMKNGVKNHYVHEQGKVAYAMIMDGYKKSNDTWPDLFIISPFSTVVKTFKDKLQKIKIFETNEGKEWLKAHCGTVHTFQGKEAEEVIYMLGCDNSNSSKGAAQWVNVNNVNVAITRAKYRVYVLGDKAVWENNRAVSSACAELDFVAAEQKKTQ